ncbi:WXG100 family type VII secretion target [Amycolatopsis vastitatis]|uniref:WXG100 family type VII secretion target n=1 Tax=Amycolatopsis vastitatis TaxID=1905142 RepID=A0A229T9D9_9PSEU|nr:hypothetical protein [Amycolatopsis vastitatis]OXM67379.1 hypothetical protein CF165_17085 [Amycolatopsis vastitatis]
MTRDCHRADLVLDRMAAITGELGELLAALEADVEPELAGWTGEAREEYLRAKRDWGRAVERMPECLERAREAFGELAYSVFTGVKTE